MNKETQETNQENQNQADPQNANQANNNPKSEAPTTPKIRQITIETDGAKINILKNEITNLELRSIFQVLLAKLNQ